MKKSRSKVVIIGLDGARLDIIKRWIKKGSLPNIKKLMNEGSHGNLRTIFPPHSMLAWTSFMTGTNPGKHGIYNTQLQVPGKYKLIVPNSTNNQSSTLYEILSENGLFPGFINIPLTYPPKKINGIIISSWLAPPFSNYTYPENILEKIKEIGYKIQPESLHKEEKNFVKDVYETTEKRVEVTKWLIKNYDWDVIAVLITGTEHMHHNFAAFFDKNHPDHNPKEENIIKNYYEFVDKKIGELLKVLDKNTNILIMSDHGFGPSYGEVYLNNLLKRYGYFEEKKKINPLRYVFRFLEMSGIANKLRNRFQMDILKFLPKRFQNMIIEGRAEDIPADWKKTKAYCTGILGDMRINLKGREPEGVVKQKDYEKIRNGIIEKLSNDEDVKGIIKKVYKREDLYNGPCLKNISDLYVEFDKCCTSSIKINGDKIIGTRIDTGFHTMDGILIAYGPDIGNQEIKNAKIIDIAPTVLHSMNLPVLKDMDGKVLEIFKKDSEVGERKIKSLEGVKRKQEELVRSKEEEKEIRERLKKLGYLD